VWRGRPRPRAIMASYHLCNRAQLHPTPLLMLSLLFTHCTPHRLSVASVSLGFCIIGSIYLARQHLVSLFMSVFLHQSCIITQDSIPSLLTYPFFLYDFIEITTHLGLSLLHAFDVVFTLMFNCLADVC